MATTKPNIVVTRNAWRGFFHARTPLAISLFLFACPPLKEGQVCKTTYDCESGLHCVPDPHDNVGTRRCDARHWLGCYTVCRAVCASDGGLSDGGVGYWCGTAGSACVYEHDVTNTGENWDYVSGDWNHYCVGH